MRSLTWTIGVAWLCGMALGGSSAAQHDESAEHGSGGSVERWLPRLESEDRDGWQKPAHVLELMQLEPGMRVADLGAGTGYFLGGLSAAVGAGGAVLGLDVDHELVAYMAERAHREGWDNVEAKAVPFDDPGLAPASVDRVLIVNTWHHIDGRGSYARKLAEALRADGAVVIVEYTMDSPYGPPPEHRLGAAQLVAELESAGLAASLVEEELPHQYVVVARRR